MEYITCKTNMILHYWSLFLTTMIIHDILQLSVYFIMVCCFESDFSIVSCIWGKIWLVSLLSKKNMRKQKTPQNRTYNISFSNKTSENWHYVTYLLNKLITANTIKTLKWQHATQITQTEQNEEMNKS